MAPTLEQWRWRIGDDTGASAISIWHAMTEEDGLDKYANCVPHDSSDFGRCARLLEEFGWKERIKEMGEVSPMWQAMAAHWDSLTTMWTKGDSRGVDKRIRAIHDELNRLPAEEEEDWLEGESVLFPSELKARLDALVDPEDVDPRAFDPGEDILDREEAVRIMQTLRRNPDLRDELASLLLDKEGG